MTVIHRKVTEKPKPLPLKKTQVLPTPPNRDFILDGKVEESTVKIIVEGIIKVNQYDKLVKLVDEKYSPEPIKLVINTYGGSLYDANFLIGLIETSETPVYTYCYGKAMSAGFYIFASGHKRFATYLATFMYHDASVGMNDTIHGLGYTLEHFTNMRNLYNEYMLSVTNIPREIFEEKNRIKEDWYVFGEEAHKHGLVDEIIPFRNDKKIFTNK